MTTRSGKGKKKLDHDRYANVSGSGSESLVNFAQLISELRIFPKCNHTLSRHCTGNKGKMALCHNPRHKRSKATGESGLLLNLLRIIGSGGRDSNLELFG